MFGLCDVKSASGFWNFAVTSTQTSLYKHTCVRSYTCIEFAAASPLQLASCALCQQQQQQQKKRIFPEQNVLMPSPLHVHQTHFICVVVSCEWHRPRSDSFIPLKENAFTPKAVQIRCISSSHFSRHRQTLTGHYFWRRFVFLSLGQQPTVFQVKS